MRAAVFSLLVILTICVLAVEAVFAQNPPTLGGVAINVEVADAEASEGDIMSITKDGFTRSAVAFDIQMYGVIAAAPILSVEPKTDSTRSILSSGATRVKVSANPEAIKAGDFITSSENAGVGQKATQSGYVIGKALADYDDKSQNGLIPVDVNIGYADVVGGLGGRGIRGLIPSLLSNPLNLRYLLAAIVGILIFLAATYAFIKLLNTGLAALGRNPLGRATILSGMLISGLVVVVLALAGVAAVAAIIGVGPIKLPLPGL